LSNTKLIAPTFYIISGTQPNEGCVLALTREQLYGRYNLDVEKGIWFLAQTNYDRDQPDPKDDPRRTIAEETMNKIGMADISTHNLLEEVLTLKPIFNDDTVETVIFPSYLDQFDIYVWTD